MNRKKANLIIAANSYSLKILGDEAARALILKIQSHPELWNIKDPSYKTSNQKKTRIYEEIDKELVNENVRDANGQPISSRNYWNKLLSKFRIERNKAVKPRSGSSPTKTNWRFYDEMRFLEASHQDSESRTSTHEFMNPLSNITNRTNISPVDIESSLDLQPSSSHHYNGTDFFVVDSQDNGQDLFVVDSQESFDEYQEISARNEKSTIENFETPKIPSSVKMSLASFGKIRVDKKHIKSQLYSISKNRGAEQHSKLIEMKKESERRLMDALELKKKQNLENLNIQRREQVNSHFSKMMELELNDLPLTGQERVKHVITEAMRFEKMGQTNYKLCVMNTVQESALQIRYADIQQRSSSNIESNEFFEL